MSRATKYRSLLLLFTVALWMEGHVVRLRDWAQRRKMACIPDVPQHWEEGRSW